MRGGDWREAIGEAQAGVAEAQSALLAPTAEGMERAWAPLERASGALTRLIECVKAEGAHTAEGPRRELRGQVEKLGREVVRLRALLEGAATLRLGWARKLYAAACGYTAQGEAALPELARRVSLEG